MSWWTSPPYNYVLCILTKFPMDHQFTLYFQRIETLHKTQTGELFCFFFQHSIFSPKQSRLFMQLRKKSLKNAKQEKEKCLLLTFSSSPTLSAFSWKMCPILSVLRKERSLKQWGNRRKSWWPSFPPFSKLFSITFLTRVQFMVCSFIQLWSF